MLCDANTQNVIQPVGNDRLNLYFGREECLNAIRIIVSARTDATAISIRRYRLRI